MQWTQVAIGAFFILILVERQGVEYSAAVLIFAAVLMASGVSRVAFGWYSDRLEGRIPLLTGYAVGLSLLLVLAGAAQLVQSLASTGVMILSCLAVFSWNGVAFTAVAELAGPARAGAALGLHGTLMRAITLPAAIGFGWCATRIGWSGGLVLLSAFPAIAAIMMLQIRDVEMRRFAASDNH
jgi:sugar phosphate permease